MPDVFPCKCPEGHFLVGVPAVKQSVTKAEADELVATKAFTLSRSGKHDEPDEGPAPAGPSDSQ